MPHSTRLRERYAAMMFVIRLKSVSVMDDTHQDDGQNGKCGRPDTCIHRKHGETLQNVCRACGPTDMLSQRYVNTARLPCKPSLVLFAQK